MFFATKALRHKVCAWILISYVIPYVFYCAYVVQKLPENQYNTRSFSGI